MANAANDFVFRTVPKSKLNMLKATVCPVVGFTAALFIANAAIAQTKIEQMIVTAQKRSQDIQQVPASISAFSGETLQERQVKTVSDLLSTTPNVKFTLGSAMAPTVVIRGVGVDSSDSSNDPSVAFHVDGVYQPRMMSVLGVMNDLDSVEVLRGPQGTLYGRNATSGVINFNTKRATDTFEASATVFGGSYERYGARGYVSGPIISDKLALRISGLVDRTTGWGKNLYTGERLEGDYFYSYRLSARIKPVEEVTIDLIGSLENDHNTHGEYTFWPIVSPNYSTIASVGQGQYTTDPWRNYAGGPNEKTIRHQAFTAIGTWDISPDVSLKSITGIQHHFDHMDVDLDTMPFYYIDEINTDSSNTFSQEVNLNAKLFDRLDTVTGLYYLKDHFVGGGDARFGPGNFPFPLTNPGGPAIGIIYKGDIRATSKAAFFDATLSITDQLRLLAGVRRTFDHKDADITSWYQPGNVPGNPAVPCETPTRAPDLDYHSTTVKAGVQYDFTPEITGYVQWQNGFKTGSYNISSCGQNYKPERVYSWEAGVKSRLFNDTMSLNVTAFSYNYIDMQQSRNVGVTAVVDNASKARIKGIEIESVVNFTDDLRVDASVGLLDTKYIGYVGSIVAGGPTIDATGNSLTKAPDVTANLGIEYTMRLGDFGELKTRGEVAYTSEVNYSQFATIDTRQPAYALFNAFFTFTPDDCPYQFQAFVKNIANKAYHVNMYYQPLLNYDHGVWGDPRLFGVEATVKF